MSIRPIDFQSMIPKNIKLSQENQNLNNKERFEHQTLVIQDQRNKEKQLKRINTFDRKTYPKINSQDHHKNRQGKNRNFQEDKKEKQENDEITCNERLSTGKGIKIDIMI